MPLVPLDSQPNTKILENNHSKPPKRPVLTMHRATSKIPSSNANNSTSSAPPSRLGYKASQTTLSQGSPAVPRSPKPTVKREAGSVLGTESIVTGVPSRRSSNVGPTRPSSSASTASNARTEIHSGTQSLRARPRTIDVSKRPSSPKFFHASDTKAAARKSLQTVITPTITGDISQPRLQSQPSKFFYASEATNPPQTHLTPRLPTIPPIANPQTPITSPQQSLSLSNNTRNVKFIYANGTEEVLESRRKNPSTSEGSSRPPSPNPYHLSPGPIPSPSKAPTSSASSVLSSPTQKGSSSIERRASIESKVRQGRALSVGGNGVAQEVFLVPEALRSPVAPPRSLPGDEPNLTINPIAMTLKMREELAANARRERKVMDLEISNASLLAINRTLERKMKKQTSELRRYRRLARSGDLKPKAASTKKNSSTSAGPTTGILEKGEEKGNENVEVEAEEGTEETDEEEEEDEDEEESSTGDETQSYQGKRALVSTDTDKVSAELQKHQALLDASAKTDALLVRCEFMIDEMMTEARKALEYKVAASDVKIGGRVLRSDDEDEEEEDEGEEGDGEDGEGFHGGMTETEMEDGLTTEGDTTDDGGYGDESGGDEDDEDEGNVTEAEDEMEPEDQ
ncbi:hypothetical protein L211DRAFT_846222 [Terfezia boudieri ATCC MYA-4762]|uniref:Uncharacterized protein n=1 Tax=Terfezia boudieri ATCC MYA-4762 TaxID=1051890 RepID=A0A3N4M385_9PEZI|nr:hypothetical protein L211DRAFT_846222 [Terfezia boudieri ATCC MYA-4762]